MITNFIGFFHENNEYGCFSNWYPATFEYAGKRFAHTEQFMMFHKVLMFRKYDLADQIMQTDNPKECKKIARQHFPEFDSDIWEQTCEAIVKRGVKAKFAQNVDILNILLDTGNALLAECSPWDTKWGIGIDISDPDRLEISKWKGSNLLGRVLMEVRDELRQEVLQAPDGKLRYINASDLDPIPEWNMMAGELKRIPQFYQTIHAYADTLKSFHEKDAFFNGFSLYDWEISMRTNMGGGLPVIGFYELKQDIYDIACRLQGSRRKTAERLAFCKKYIPFLQMIANDPDLKETCQKHSVYVFDGPHRSLTDYLYQHFMREAYDADIVVHNYNQLVHENGIEEWVADPPKDKLYSLDAEHLLGCIAWHFRRDHFIEGSLIANSIAEGHMLRLLNAYVDKLNA